LAIGGAEITKSPDASGDAITTTVTFTAEGSDVSREQRCGARCAYAWSATQQAAKLAKAVGGARNAAEE
jgi:hypothetical protein